MYFFLPTVNQLCSLQKQLNRVLALKSREDEYILYVLSSSTLQKWHISRNDKKENSDEVKVLLYFLSEYISDFLLIFNAIFIFILVSV